MTAAVFHAALVGGGGFLGALARYGVSRLLQPAGAPQALPYGTVTVNLVGCLVFGLLAGHGDARLRLDADARLFALVGLLGGFTTFSTFGSETFLMLRDAQYLRAAVHVGLHVTLGPALVWLGVVLGGR